MKPRPDGHPPDPAAPRRVALSVVFTGASQGVSMIAGGVLAILVAALFGSTAQTDGFFLAYGVYSLLVLVAQSTRTAIPARLLETETLFGAFDRYLAGAALLFLASGVALLGFAGPLATLLTGSDAGPAHAATAESLRILWPAVGGQLFAALAAAMLGVAGDFTRAALAYAAGGLATIGAFLALHGPFGIRALPVAVVIGTLVSVCPLAHGLVRIGWRPAPAGSGALGAARIILVSSTAGALSQVLFVVSLSVAARVGSGDATLYSYAYFALGLLVALVSSSVSAVLAAPLAATWDRDPRSLRPVDDDVFRTGLVVLAPILAAAALLGRDLAGAVLGKFTHTEIAAVWRAFLILSPSAVTALAIAIPLVALFALGRYRAIALVAPPIVALHVALSVVAAVAGSLVLVAAAATVGSFAITGALLGILYGREAGRAVVHLVRELARVALPAALAFGLPALLLLVRGGAAVSSAAWLLGLVLYAGAVAGLLPAHRELALRLLRALGTRPRALEPSAPS